MGGGGVMKEVLRELSEWSARGERVALATVVAARRSAPRPPGAKLAVNESGEIAGGVSGGCVEGAVVEIAHRVIRGAPPQLQSFGIADADAWEVGLPCGGEIEVWIQFYEPGQFEQVARAGGRATEVTMLEGSRPGAKLLVEADGARAGSLGAPELDDEAARVAAGLLWSEQCERRGALFFDVTAPAPRLIVFGAVDIAVPLCTLARTAGLRPYVVDPRARFARPERFPDAEQVIAAWPEEAFGALGGIDPATSIAVLTHDPKLDDAALQIALRSPARFVGAMGSRRAQERRRERLMAAGLSEDELTRLSAPLGLDLGGVTAGETALSVLAEVVAARHGHGGGRLSQARGRIHEVAA
jgi:xanthine dehydrogenase accessory factor